MSNIVDQLAISEVDVGSVKEIVGGWLNKRIYHRFPPTVDCTVRLINWCS